MVSAAFGAALAAQRREFNALAAEARRRYPGFDQDAFTQFLVEAADPVVDAVAHTAPDSVHGVAAHAFRMGLEMVGQRLADGSPRTSGLVRAWTTVLPRFAPLVARAPERTLGMLSNAALHLATLPGVRVQRWERDMAALAPLVDSIEHLRALGQVLAWRAGAAHYRQGAIAAADGLPEALALAAFRCADAGSWQLARASLASDPWWRAEADPDGVSTHVTGSFAGFGGLFTTPPRLAAAESCFVVQSGERAFLLIADAYGVVLLPAGEADAGAVANLPYLVEGDDLLVGRQRIALALPPEGLALCATASTIALSSPYTHAIQLVARQ